MKFNVVLSVTDPLPVSLLWLLLTLKTKYTSQQIDIDTMHEIVNFNCSAFVQQIKQ